MTDANTTITTGCDHCGNGAVYRPGAIHVTVYTHGVITMEFFCIVCRRENRRVIDFDLAQHLEFVGVPSTLVNTPQELTEHPPADTPPITELDVDRLEAMSTDVFNRLLEQEVGDVEP